MANMTKFPHGMGHVADQLHSMGLGFGMYSSAGTYTCGQYGRSSCHTDTCIRLTLMRTAGSLGYEKQDAQTLANWGVDYLKYDNCYNEGQSGTPLITYNRYKNMSDALNATGRPILYSMCNWGEDYPWKWAQTMANSWRMSGDIYDSFDRPDERCPCSGDEGYNCALAGFHCSVMNILNKMAAIQSKSQSGAWNDMDMLEVGNGGMTDEESKLHFSMWAMMRSPLIMGTDIRSLDAQSLSIYSNPAVIAINQDPAGNAGIRNWRYLVNATDEYGQGEISLWTNSLANGDYVVALVNAGNAPMMMNATLTDIFFDQSSGGSSGPSPLLKQTWDVYDLWATRMNNATANALLHGNVTSNMIIDANSTVRYNATKMSYADGLAANSTALMGSMISSIAPMGTLTANVPRHGVGLFRLRSRGAPSMKRRDEL